MTGNRPCRPPCPHFLQASLGLAKRPSAMLCLDLPSRSDSRTPGHRGLAGQLTTVCLGVRMCPPRRPDRQASLRLVERPRCGTGGDLRHLYIPRRGPNRHLAGPSRLRHRLSPIVPFAVARKCFPPMESRIDDHGQNTVYSRTWRVRNERVRSTGPAIAALSLAETKTKLGNHHDDDVVSGAARPLLLITCASLLIEIGDITEQIFSGDAITVQ